MKRVGQLLLIFSFIIFIAGREPFLASAASRTVKVGYYPILNFQEYDQVRHQYRGYGYEYLQAVASYAGWELELVPVSYQEAIQRLADGQLDLIFHAVRNQKLEESASVRGLDNLTYPEFFIKLLYYLKETKNSE